MNEQAAREGTGSGGRRSVLQAIAVGLVAARPRPLVRSAALGCAVGVVVLVASCGGSGTTTPVGVAIGSLCSGISFSVPVGAEAEDAVDVSAGVVELTVQNTGAANRTVVVAAVEAGNLPVVTSYDSVRQQRAVDVEALGLPVEVVHVSHRDGFQPVVDADSLDSAVLLARVEVAESSEVTTTIDVEPGTYLIMDPDSVFCEPPLVLRVAETLTSDASAIVTTSEAPGTTTTVATTTSVTAATTTTSSTTLATTTSSTSPLLPTYVEVVATYPADVILCTTEAELNQQNPDGSLEITIKEGPW